MHRYSGKLFVRWWTSRFNARGGNWQPRFETLAPNSTRGASRQTLPRKFRPEFETLEPRLALAAITELLSPTINAGPLSNQIAVRLSADRLDVDVSVDGVLTNMFPLNQLSSLTINGEGGNDVLTLDYSNRDPIPLGGLNFNGGEGTENQLLVSEGSFVALYGSIASPTAGSIELTRRDCPLIFFCNPFNFVGRSVGYSDVAAVVLSPAVIENLFFKLPVGPNSNVTVGEDFAAAPNFSQISGPTLGNTLFINPSKLVVFLGDGGDSISFVTPDPEFNSSTNVTVNGGNGADAITGNSLVTSTVWTLNGGAGNDTLIGGSGNDRINGGPGNDTMSGGPGNDVYEMDADQEPQNDIVNEKLNGGNDTLDFSSTETHSVSVDLTKTARQFVSPEFSFVLNSGANVENVVGGNMDDRLVGNASANSLRGGLGNDRIIGAGGNDTLEGGGGNDTFEFDTDFALGTDLVDETGGGMDTLDFSPTTTRTIVVDLAKSATQVINAGLTISMSSNTMMENVIGGNLADKITGNSLRNVLSGKGGNDTLIGGLGNDTYLFDADTALGLDTVNEAVNGGLDTLNFSATTTRAVAVNLGLTNIQVVNAGLSLKLLSDTAIERVIGGSGDDILIGNALANIFTGGGGNDTLTGGPGNDTYLFDNDVELFLGTDRLNELAGGGIDTLNFSAITTHSIAVNLADAAPQIVNVGLSLDLNSGATFENVIGGFFGDTLIGNSLANTLTGGPGPNNLNGGPGDDTYVFDADLDFGLNTLTDPSGFDTLDFHLTSTQALFVDLSSVSLQFVTENLSFVLGSATTFEKVIGGDLGDTIIGNALNNILIGGPGDDFLRGGAGRDIIISNAGINGTVIGDEGDDLLILGSTIYDTKPSALRTILTEWSSTTKNYSTRVNNLRIGVSGVKLQASGEQATVFRDSLFHAVALGGAGSDWHFAAVDHVVGDLTNGELVDVLA